MLCGASAVVGTGVVKALGSACIVQLFNTFWFTLGSANQTSRRLYMALGAVWCGPAPAGIDPNDTRKDAWEKPRERLLRV